MRRLNGKGVVSKKEAFQTQSTKGSQHAAAMSAFSDAGKDISQGGPKKTDFKAPTYAAFLDAYRAIVADAVARLERGRFACFVVGEVRDADGFMHSLVADTIAAFAAAGGRLYNHAVMMLPLHSLPMRAPRAGDFSISPHSASAAIVLPRSAPLPPPTAPPRVPPFRRRWRVHRR